MNIKDNRSGEKIILFEHLKIGDVYYANGFDDFICIKIDEHHCLLKNIGAQNWNVDIENENEIVHPLNVTLVIDD